MPWIKTGFRSLIPSLTWQPHPRAASVVAAAGAAAVVVDLGAGGRRIAPHVVTVDFQPAPGTRLVADCHHLPLAAGSADLVIATGLLEHVADAEATVNEIHRVLKPGGRLHLEVPFLQQHHADPIDLRRFTLEGLERFVEARGFTVADSGVHIGPTVTIVTLLAYYLALWFEGPGFVGRVLSNLVFAGASLLLFPLKFLDAWLIHQRGAHRLAFGVFCTALREER